MLKLVHDTASGLSLTGRRLGHGWFLSSLKVLHHQNINVLRPERVPYRAETLTSLALITRTCDPLFLINKDVRAQNSSIAETWRAVVGKHRNLRMCADSVRNVYGPADAPYPLADAMIGPSETRPGGRKHPA
jgi:hypothetical protein